MVTGGFAATRGWSRYNITDGANLMRLLQEFKEFAMKGSVIDLAVGVVIGAAFNGVVQSLVKDVIMPPLGWLTGRVNFAKLSFKLPTGAEPVEIMYGNFVNACITFLIQAFAIFLVIKLMNRLRREKEVQVQQSPEKPQLTLQEQLLTEIRDELKTGRPA